MKFTVISYSFTGNNDALASSIARDLSAKHIKVAEPKPRTMGTIIFDMIFNRTPKVNLKVENVYNSEAIIFVAPVWMGHVAAPLRAYFKNIKATIGRYAFISISGGALGPNPKLAGDLSKRIGKKPSAIINPLIVDLLPSEPKPTVNVTSAHRITDEEVNNLSQKITITLRETFSDVVA
jgi:hypothetical protein